MNLRVFLTHVPAIQGTETRLGQEELLSSAARCSKERGKAGRSLLGVGKGDADLAMSNREFNLGLQFQNRVQTTRILQLKKPNQNNDLSLPCAFPFPIPGSHQCGGAASRARTRSWEAPGCFWALFLQPWRTWEPQGGQLVRQELLGLTSAGWVVVCNGV